LNFPSLKKTSQKARERKLEKMITTKKEKNQPFEQLFT